MGNKQGFAKTYRAKYSILEPGDDCTSQQTAEISYKTYDVRMIKHELYHRKCLNRLLVIPDFFSVEECEGMISRCNNFQDLSDEYLKEYRNATRELVKDKELSDLIFKRLKSKIDLDRIGEFVVPYGIDGRGVWKACGINEMMRFSKYNEEEYFKIHADGQFRRTEDERSIYTLLIYLNHDFTGGETRFYGEPNQIKQEYTSYDLLYTLKPKIGQLALFNQDFHHEGCAVMKGTKYILRTEIMYLRIDSHSVPRDRKFERSKIYQTIGQLFKKSDQLEKEEELFKASECYLKGQELLLENGKSFEYFLKRDFFIPSNNNSKSRKNKLTILPEEIIFAILTFLNEGDICSLVLPLNRYLNQLARSPIIWKPIYQKYWNGTLFQKLSERDSFTDWYYHVRVRNFTEHSFKPICIDFTTELVFFQLFNAEKPLETIPYLGRRGDGHYSSAWIGRKKGYSDYFYIFKYLEECELDGINILDIPTYFSKIVEDIDLAPSHPLMISIPPRYLHRHNFRSYVDLVLRSQAPAVCFISRHAMVAYYYNIPNCIVIERDVSVTMSVVLNFKSFEGDIYVANDNNPIKNEIKRGYNQLTGPKSKEITYQVIVINLEEDWINEIPNILPSVNIIRSTDPQEAFRGCQMYASQEDIRPMSTFWSGQSKDHFHDEIN